MSTMNISLPDTLKAFVDEQVAGRGAHHAALRRLLLDGAESAPGDPADDPYFEGLRARARRTA